MQIVFDLPEGFLYTLTEIPYIFQSEADEKESLASLGPERYTWLTELIAHATSVNQLRVLTIKEELKAMNNISSGNHMGATIGN
jgi:hypothetical protein